MSKFKKKDSELISEKRYNEGILANGEKLSKSDKIFASIGTLEELNAYIGLVKSQNFNLQQSSKMFFIARLTQIQETVLSMINSLSTSKKNPEQYEKSRFSKIADRNITELQTEIDKQASDTGLEKKDYLMILPGQSQLQSQLLYTRTIVRRAERQILASKNQFLGLVPEEHILRYLNVLGDYFLYVANSKN